LTKRYLNTIPLSQAVARVLRSIAPLTEKEVLSTDQAKGRLTAQAVFAKVSSPAFTCASMDGYAVDYRNTLDADVTKPLSLKKHTEAIQVNTGDPLPEETNGVIMREEVEETSLTIIIRQPAYLWQNVRLVGEDIIERDLLLPANHPIGSLDMALFIAAGVTSIAVWRKPRLTIIPTGKEILDIFTEGIDQLTRGRLIDIDSYALSSLAEDLGFEVSRKAIARTKEDLRRCLAEAVAEADVTCVIAGSSAGTEDYTEELIQEYGTLIFHGIALMPGKPAMFGIVAEKPVFGIPGYPVSAIMAFKSLIEPVYERMMGLSIPHTAISCFPASKIPSRMGMAEAVRVNLIRAGRRYYAFPLPRGASILSSLAMADGIITIPAHVEGYGEGEKVRCELLVPKHNLEHRLHIVGSHDLSLDILRDLLRTTHTGLDLMASHVGSEGGILAVQKGLAQLATTHVIDENEKTYNVPLAKKYLGNRPWVLVHIAKRSQGIVTAPGNPLKIGSVRDLTRPGLRFVNRQFGSGTRILFDMMLKKEGIDGSSIRGYDREESSHTAVGLLVKEGVADAGIAIYGASHIFSLHFVPLTEEEYDLLVTEGFTKDRRFTILLRTLKSGEFRNRLESLGGYDASGSGTVKYTYAP
jgi:molybdenum cofactor synthesis domain-containing protein